MSQHRSKGSLRMLSAIRCRAARSHLVLRPNYLSRAMSANSTEEFGPIESSIRTKVRSSSSLTPASSFNSFAKSSSRSYFLLRQWRLRMTHGDIDTTHPWLNKEGGMGKLVRVLPLSSRWLQIRSPTSVLVF